MMTFALRRCAVIITRLIAIKPFSSFGFTSDVKVLWLLPATDGCIYFLIAGRFDLNFNVFNVMQLKCSGTCFEEVFSKESVILSLFRISSFKRKLSHPVWLKSLSYFSFFFLTIGFKVLLKIGQFFKEFMFHILELLYISYLIRTKILFKCTSIIIVNRIIMINFIFWQT